MRMYQIMYFFQFFFEYFAIYLISLFLQIKIRRIFCKIYIREYRKYRKILKGSGPLVKEGGYTMPKCPICGAEYPEGEEHKHEEKSSSEEEEKTSEQEETAEAQA